MSPNLLRVLAGILLLGGTTASGLALARPHAAAAMPTTEALVPVPPPQTLLPAERDSMADAVVRAAPFRRGRIAPPVPYDPQSLNETPPGERAAPPKPSLRLVGIVWGVRPTAIISGPAGVSGAWVASRGDTVGGLKLIGIQVDRIAVSGYDTTWNLRLQELE